MKLISPITGYKILKDLTGKRYGKLTAIQVSKVRKTAYWDFQCDCGNVKPIRGVNVTDGRVKTCGSCKITPERKLEKELFFKKDIYRNHITGLKRRHSKHTA